MKGYTPRLHEAAGAEALLYSKLGTRNASVRRKVNQLRGLLSGIAESTWLVSTIEGLRAAWWEAWKGTMTPQVAAVVNRVQVAHHGPLRLGHTGGGATALSAVLHDVIPKMRVALETISSRHSQAAGIVELCEKIALDLDDIEQAARQ